MFMRKVFRLNNREKNSFRDRAQAIGPPAEQDTLRLPTSLCFTLQTKIDAVRLFN